MLTVALFISVVASVTISLIIFYADSNKTVCVDIVKTDEHAVTPTCGSLFAAGYDLYAMLEDGYDTLTISPHCTYKIHTGIKMAIPSGYFGAVFARSGIALKRSLRPANCVGVIDSDYRGEVIVALHNDSDEPMSINNGERVAQIVILKYLKILFREVNELDGTERGSGGFGSTGR